LQDVQDGFVSPEAARRDYGVAIVDGTVDDAATQQLRAPRPLVKAFHRKGYVDAIG
jgi:N-methylhydantoinase B